MNPFFHLRPYRDGDETSLAKNADNYLEYGGTCAMFFPILIR